MDRGSFSAENIVGPCQLATHATDVDMNGFSEALDLTVDKGDVNLKPRTGELGRMAVRIHSGNIDLALPENQNFDMNATTEHGDIENEFGAPLKVESTERGAKLVGVLGSGPNLVLTTDRGSITVRKSNPGDKKRPRSRISCKVQIPVPRAARMTVPCLLPPSDAPNPLPRPHLPAPCAEPHRVHHGTIAVTMPKPSRKRYAGYL